MPLKLQNEDILSKYIPSVKYSGKWNSLFYIYLSLLAIFTYGQENTAMCSMVWRRKAVYFNQISFIVLVSRSLQF